LALFYVELRDENGNLRNIEVARLKDKLGTRKVPTAELYLHGAPAIPVMELKNGVRNIVPMLQLTRTWNSVTAVSFMRRGLALARDYAQKRQAFGAHLSAKPLHLETLADMQAEFEAAFMLSFFVVELIGKEEQGDLSEEEGHLLRLLTSLNKLVTGKQAVACASEVLEAFGGAGYVEDTGLPLLLRDSQVLPIWEGTTNVLSLDTLRAIAKEEGEGLRVLKAKVTGIAHTVKQPQLAQAGHKALTAVSHAEDWLLQAMNQGQPTVEAGARRFALTLGRALELALLTEHAHWSLINEENGRFVAAAHRFAHSHIDLIIPLDLAQAAALANDLPLPI
jgi:hypothetical protein